MMRLPKAGAEYAHWSTSGAPSDGDFEVLLKFEDNTDSGWLVCENDGGLLKLLVRGPESTGVADSVELPIGSTYTFIRLLDTPETVIRPGGVIEVY